MKNITNIYFLISLALVSSCGREISLETPARRPIKVKELDALSVKLSEFSTFATTFSMFFVPEKKELTWKTDLYKKSDSYTDKVAKIMKNIIRKSDEFDKYDQKILDLNKVKAPLTEKYEELECDFDYTEECAQIDEELKKIDATAVVTLKLPDGTEKQVDYEGYKSWLIEEIQASVDNYDRTNPELNRPKNWMLYGDAPLYEILVNEDKSVQITFPNVGPYGSQNYYSTQTGEIFDVKLTPSEYNPKIELLKFKIKEKGADGKFTSFVWEYILERSFVVSKLRYKGDVFKVDSKGKRVRIGICKIDFARKGT